MLIKVTIGRHVDDIFQKRLEGHQITRILGRVVLLKSSYRGKIFSIRPKSFVFIVEFLMPGTVKSVLGLFCRNSHDFLSDFFYEKAVPRKWVANIYPSEIIVIVNSSLQSIKNAVVDI